MARELLEALEASDVVGASGYLKKELSRDVSAWEIHLSLFPAVQRVLNPPFINPHLPKMYRIYREFIPYLEKDDISDLVRLEVNEYTRRPKLGKLPKRDPLTSLVSFKDIESAIRGQDWQKTAILMSTFFEQEGKVELTRRLLLLGSGYLDDSLGHSISCTAFILLEMLERSDQDPWPALSLLADYFCKGQFHSTPILQKLAPFPSEESFEHHLLRATSGRGIVNLHHTITRYAIERIRQFFSEEEYHHMIGAWIAFLGDKEAKPVRVGPSRMKHSIDDRELYEMFSRLKAKPVVAFSERMMASQQGRRQLGRILIKGLCDQYQGNYNPHYLTGLGSTLWVIDRYWNRPAIALNALFQYVSFFFDSLKSEN
jgi:hypothetical protein